MSDQEMEEMWEEMWEETMRWRAEFQRLVSQGMSDTAADNEVIRRIEAGELAPIWLN